MESTKISESIKYIGANDEELKIFENQYDLPKGMAYNSYLIKDEKVVVMDTIDRRKTDTWLENLENELQGRNVDYLVISHLEPDHAGSIKIFLDKYPNTTIVGNSKTFEMLPQFFDINPDIKKIIVKEGDTLNIGKHTLQFIMAPMVHWPEVMVTYEQTEKVLFSADAFGKFGIIEDGDDDWACEARRYYFGIVGKFGAPVQTLLNKAKNLDIKIICPLHGPVLKENLEYYINKYDIWSSYKPEDEGILIACASIYGHTMEVAKKLEEILKERGVEKVVLTDLANDDIDEAVEDAFRYSKVVLAASSYNGRVFPPMEHFLNKLKDRNYQNRTMAIIENGSWAPSAARSMKEIVDNMKNINLLDRMITIKSALKECNVKDLEELADELNTWNS